MVRVLQQWRGNLRERAANVLLVGADQHTCDVAGSAMSCAGSTRRSRRPSAHSCASWTTRRGSAPGKSRNMFGRHVLLKWWISATLCDGGFHVLFSDPDIAWSGDAFAGFAAPFDLQGLSDIEEEGLPTNRFHHLTCRNGWMDKQYGQPLRAEFPCQSAGIFYARATAPTRSLLASLPPRPPLRSQGAAVGSSALPGGGDTTPRRPRRRLAAAGLRLLPPRRWVNIDYAPPANASAAADLIAVHCGYVDGDEEKLRRLGERGLVQKGLASHRRAVAGMRRLSNATSVGAAAVDAAAAAGAAALCLGIPALPARREHDNLSTQAAAARALVEPAAE